jgi:hypothetical protein
MFEFFMMIGFLGAGLCHLLPSVESAESGKKKVQEKEGKKNGSRRSGKRKDDKNLIRKSAANARKQLGQASFPWAA